MGRSRSTFHTSPHEPHRQYDDALTTLLAVFTSVDRQAGQCVGAST